MPFFSISGSEFVEMFVGVGASRVRDLFDQAKRNAPCIVFVDEIDAVGRQRGAGLGGSPRRARADAEPDPGRDGRLRLEHQRHRHRRHQPARRARPGPAATGPLRPPGRAARPDIKGRKAILEVHAKGKPFDKNVELDVLAQQSPGFSGADLANLINEGAILAARRNKKTIGDVRARRRRSTASSPARSARAASCPTRRSGSPPTTRAGTPSSSGSCPTDPVAQGHDHLPRHGGWLHRALPTEDRYYRPRPSSRPRSPACWAATWPSSWSSARSRPAPENDIEKATNLARKHGHGIRHERPARARWRSGKRDELVFLGREIGEQRNYSEKTAEAIDEEVREIIDRAYVRATETLTTLPRPARPRWRRS